MRTGVSYFGHYDPRHIKTDLTEMGELELDDVFVGTMEIDFAHFTGKVEFTPLLAKDLGIRPIAIFLGALNSFGWGPSSQFLLDHPEGFQVAADGSHRAQGCYANPICSGRIKEMIDIVSARGFEGYFIDEPMPLDRCYCPSCCAKFEQSHEGKLSEASKEVQREFRDVCLTEYVREITDYCKANHPHMETMCCFVPQHRQLWSRGADVESLDNVGTDIYLVNKDVDVEAMTPLVRELASICRKAGKKHHEWLQCAGVKRGREQRIVDQGKILLRERPDGVYAWTWHGQPGTPHACQDPELSWAKVAEVFRLAKEKA